MIIPTFSVRDISEAIRFHTEVLDFHFAFVMNEDEDQDQASGNHGSPPSTVGSSAKASSLQNKSKAVQQ